MGSDLGVGMARLGVADVIRLSPQLCCFRELDLLIRMRRWRGDLTAVCSCFTEGYKEDGARLFPERQERRWAQAVTPAIPNLMQEKCFHHEGGQTLEQETGEVVDNPPMEISKAWISKTLILLWAGELGETSSSSLPYPLSSGSVQTADPFVKPPWKHCWAVLGSCH